MVCNHHFLSQGLWTCSEVNIWPFFSVQTWGLGTYSGWMLLSTLWKKEKSFFQSRLRIHSRCSYELGGWEKVYYYILEQIEDDQFPDCQFFSWCMRKPEYKKGLHNFNLHESSKNALVVVDVLHERCDQRVETIRHNFRSRHTASASFLSLFFRINFSPRKAKIQSFT